MSHHCLEKLFFVVMLNTSLPSSSSCVPVNLILWGLAIGPLYVLLSNILPQQTLMKSYDIIWLLILQTSVRLAYLYRYMSSGRAYWPYRSLSHGCFFLLYLVFPESIKLNNQIMLWITKSSLVSMHRMKYLKNYLLAGVFRL